MRLSDAQTPTTRRPLAVTGNNVRHVGSNFLPQCCFQRVLLHEPAQDNAGNSAAHFDGVAIARWRRGWLLAQK